MVQLPITHTASRRRRARRWFVAIIVLVSLLLFAKGYFPGDEARFSSQDLGFSSVTGMSLPANLSPLAHGSAMNDNFFHTTHFWLLRGPRESLLQLVPPPHFQRSDEDAKW